MLRVNSFSRAPLSAARFAGRGEASQVTRLQDDWKPFDVWPLYLNLST